MRPQLPRELSALDELSGKLSMQFVEDKLMHSVLENDKDVVDEGKLISESINQGLGTLTPNMLFEQLVRNYSHAKQLYGETIIRIISGYDPSYVEKNIRIPEFKKELRKRISQRIERMQDQKLVNLDGTVSDKGKELASLILYVDELSHLRPKGFVGEMMTKELQAYGDRDNPRTYHRGDSYHKVSIRDSVKRAMRRGHERIISEDLVVYDRKKKGKVSIVYAIDASASMKGKKLENAKKAGIALAYHTTQKKDPVGLVVFGTRIKHSLSPTLDFSTILKDISSVRPATQTNIVLAIKKAIELLSSERATKHILLLTDAMPTSGADPQKETLEAVGLAKNADISLSIVGISLSEDGKKLAEKMVERGDGRLYVVKNIEELDVLVLEDYFSLQ